MLDPGRVHRGALILIQGDVEVSEHFTRWLYKGALLVQKHPLLLDGPRDLRRVRRSLKWLQVKWQVSHLIWDAICLIDDISIPPVIHQCEFASLGRDRGRQLILFDLSSIMLSLLNRREICLRSISCCQLLSRTQARLSHNKLLLTLRLLRRGLEHLLG